jgi:hypothetical protein
MAVDILNVSRLWFKYIGHIAQDKF